MYGAPGVRPVAKGLGVGGASTWNECRCAAKQWGHWQRSIWASQEVVGNAWEPGLPGHLFFLSRLILDQMWSRIFRKREMDKNPPWIIDFSNVVPLQFTNCP